MKANSICRSCGGPAITVFYELKGIPVHSVLLMPTREVAVTYPKGDIALAFCRDCGFIFNTAFRPERQDYSASYEGTQAFSSTFTEYARGLATRLIDRYDLRGKAIMEIGCGKGEFLSMLCEPGGNRGVGFDPAYGEGRNEGQAWGRITVIPDYYSEKYSVYIGDFICCRMTLEHIQDVGEFLRGLRRAIGERSETTVFFQVPDVGRVLREHAFWDLYYEHCSYFSIGSLARLFRSVGFDILDLSIDYGGQYLTIEARPGNGRRSRRMPEEDDLPDLAHDVARFSETIGRGLDAWKQRLQGITHHGRRAVLWGSGSKGVAFLTTLNIREEIEYVIDINPYRQGTYMPGTGQRIMGPEFLRDYQPDVVIVMNSIYREEIQQDLRLRGLTSELVTV